MSLFTSILTGGSNNHETTSEEANNFATDFVDEGVIGPITNTSDVAPMTGAFAANEQDTPAMAVDVSAGVIYVDATPTGQSSQTLRVESTATEEVTINDNSSGSTRFDWIYVKVDPDNAADPASDASDVATLVTSRSTSSSSDDGTPPTYGTLIAVVTVANGETAITDAMISDQRVLAASVQDDSLDTAKYKAGSVTSLKLAEAFFRARYQDLTTNSQETGWTVQSGWSFINPGASASGTKAITFPVEFTSIEGLILSNLGEKNSSDPTALTDTDAFKGKVVLNPTNLATTGFTANATLGDGTNFTSGERILFYWEAKGVV